MDSSSCTFFVVDIINKNINLSETRLRPLKSDPRTETKTNLKYYNTFFSFTPHWCVVVIILNLVGTWRNSSKLDHYRDAEAEIGLPNVKKKKIFFPPNLSFPSCSNLYLFFSFLFLALSISYLQHSTIVSTLTPTGRTNGPLPLFVIPSPIVRTATFGTKPAKREKQDSASRSN